MSRALVAGGSSDIGRAIAVELAGLGHDVHLWGRDAERLEASAAACGGTARTVDVRDRADLRRAALDVAAGDLRVVVWAAGLFDWAPADTADPGTWDALLDVNLAAAAHVTPLLLPSLLESRGALLYLGSGASRQTFANNAAYEASKHGLAGLAGAVWHDVKARGVRVSLVSPGLVAAGAALAAPVAQETPHLLLQPSDVAAAVRFVVTFPGAGCPTDVVLSPPVDG